MEILVDNYVRNKLVELGAVEGDESNKSKGDSTWYEKNVMPDRLRMSLKDGSKKGKGAGYPDFALTYKHFNNLVVLIENKWGLNKLDSVDEDGKLLKTSESVQNFAVNGALHYANKVIESNLYDEVYAIGISGEKIGTKLELAMRVFLVRKDEIMEISVDTLDSFSNKKFTKFHNENKMSEIQKHQLLDKAHEDLSKKSKELNKLLNNNNIDTDNRITYVSGMLLAMKDGLIPSSLLGNEPSRNDSDGKKIYDAIDNYLRSRNIPDEKRNLMMDTFTNIKVDADRDRMRELSGQNKSTDSINKEIFDFIYHNVFLNIQDASHLDSIGELYSRFLQYATGSGSDLGIVLSPPYCTKLMNQLIDVNKDSKVIDLCTGSGGFIVSALTQMIEDATDSIHNMDELKLKLESIKRDQIRACELNPKMYTLAATNMILRGDGSAGIFKGDAFSESLGSYLSGYGADRALLNPPFSYSENGMPFALRALDFLEKDGLLSIIIQDSAGTGKAIKTNKQILSRHTLLGSIKMSSDLFMPNAGVQTSIYVLKAGVPHDIKRTVRFIDFSDDGYKRTKRGTRKVGNPDQKYQDILEVWKYGSAADVEGIDVIDDVITLNGDDWNYNQHRKIDTTPTEDDFLKVVGDYLQFELSQVLKG